MAIFKILIVANFLIVAVQGQTLANVYQLHSDVFANYNKEVIPNANRSNPMDIQIGFFLLTITKFEEIDETIEVNAGLFTSWNDGGISWDPTQYGGKSSLSILQSNIWTPPLVLVNNVEDLKPIEGEFQFMSTVLYNGLTFWAPGGVMKAKCTTDISKFPFDSQTCTLQFVTWGLTQADVTLSLAPTNSFDLTFFVPNSNWKLTGNRPYTYSLGGYSGYNVDITIQREPLYFLLMVVCPTLLFSLLNPLVFLLPVESGERISLAMTILLSYAIFLTLVSAAIPSSSNPMCILLIMMVVIIIVSGMIVFSVIIISAIYCRDEKQKMNKLWRAIATKFPWKRGDIESQTAEETAIEEATWRDVSEKLGLHRNNLVQPLYETKDSGYTRHVSDITRQVSDNSRQVSDEPVEENKKTKINLSRSDHTGNNTSISWKDVAHSLDMLSLISSYVLIILILAIFFIVVRS